ncbi:hypothetical protein QOT17_009123 [Balamuthia mandrillaris]
MRLQWVCVLWLSCFALYVRAEDPRVDPAPTPFDAIYVNGNFGNDSWICTTTRFPCKTIQGALDRAFVFSVKDIYVSRGVFSGEGNTELLVFSDVNIHGEFDDFPPVQYATPIEESRTVIDGFRVAKNLFNLGVCTEEENSLGPINFYIHNFWFTRAREAAVRINQCFEGSATFKDNMWINNSGALGSALTVLGTRSTDLTLAPNQDGEGPFPKFKVEVFNNFFLKNKGPGSAIFALDTQMTIRENSFRENEAEVGAALRVMFGAVLVQDNFFVDNKASLWGGAIYSNLEDGVEVANNNFVRNKAEKGGAAAFAFSIDSQGASVWQNNEFTENTAEEGGALFFRSGSRQYFHHNYYFSNRAVNGGAIGMNCEGFSQNEPGFEDADISEYDPSCAVVLEDVYSSSNQASGSGGFLYMENTYLHGSQGDYTQVPPIILRIVSSYSDSAHEGGAIYVKDSVIMVEEVTFHSSMASHRGGALYVEAVDTPSYLYGAGLHVEGCQANRGAGLYAFSATPQVIIDNLGAVLEIETSTFTNNIATEHGGAIYVEGVSVLAIGLLNCSLSSNYAWQDGGAIYASHRVIARTGGTEMRDNFAGQNGGAIYLQGVAGEVARHVEKREAADRRQSLQTSPLLQAQAMTLINNVAQGFGGGIYAYYSIVLGESVILHPNAAPVGANIYCEESELSFVDSPQVIVANGFRAFFCGNPDYTCTIDVDGEELLCANDNNFRFGELPDESLPLPQGAYGVAGNWRGYEVTICPSCGCSSYVYLTFYEDRNEGVISFAFPQEAEGGDNEEAVASFGYGFTYKIDYSIIPNRLDMVISSTGIFEGLLFHGLIQRTDIERGSSKLTIAMGPEGGYIRPTSFSPVENTPPEFVIFELYLQP